MVWPKGCHLTFGSGHKIKEHCKVHTNTTIHKPYYPQSFLYIKTHKHVNTSEMTDISSMVGKPISLFIASIPLVTRNMGQQNPQVLVDKVIQIKRFLDQITVSNFLTLAVYLTILAPLVAPGINGILTVGRVSQDLIQLQTTVLSYVAPNVPKCITQSM